MESLCRRSKPERKESMGRLKRPSTHSTKTKMDRSHQKNSKKAARIWILRSHQKRHGHSSMRWTRTPPMGLAQRSFTRLLGDQKSSQKAQRKQLLQPRKPKKVQD